MGSIFTTVPGTNIKGFANKNVDVPIYIQFVPGVVVEVVHNRKNLRGGNDPRLTNSIIAMPHISDKPFKRKASLGNDYRYYPLLRGITDVPSKGDPVLFFSQFENKDEPPVNLAAEQADKEEMDDAIPY